MLKICQKLRFSNALFQYSNVSCLLFWLLYLFFLCHIPTPVELIVCFSATAMNSVNSQIRYLEQQVQERDEMIDNLEKKLEQGQLDAEQILREVNFSTWTISHMIVNCKKSILISCFTTAS